jgi:hypothetical protein
VFSCSFKSAFKFNLCRYTVRSPAFAAFAPAPSPHALFTPEVHMSPVKSPVRVLKLASPAPAKKMASAANAAPVAAAPDSARGVAGKD